MVKTESTRNVDDENAFVHHRIDDRIYHLVTSVEGMDRDVWKLYQDNARSTTQQFFFTNRAGNRSAGRTVGGR
jgi:hypothetical protein